MGQTQQATRKNAVAMRLNATGRIALWLITLPIRIYRYSISPLLGPHCRFEPSCSYYVENALCQHGLLRGGLLGLNRLRKCHPWHPGGFDPVPTQQKSVNQR